MAACHPAGHPSGAAAGKKSGVRIIPRPAPRRPARDGKAAVAASPRAGPPTQLARWPRAASAGRSIPAAVGTTAAMMGMMLIGLLGRARPAAATRPCLPAWGYPGTDGVQFANGHAFARLDGAGSILAWGSSRYGGSGAPTTSGHVAVFSANRAFASLDGAGSISAWGDPGYGGSGVPITSGHVAVFSAFSAFASLDGTGSISAWGDSRYGGSGTPTTTGHVAVFSNRYAFASLDGTGSISAWGHLGYGGSGAPTTTGHVAVFSTWYAFASLDDPGSISAWGLSRFGGSGAPTTTGHVAVFSTQTAFASLNGTGSISAWGRLGSGGSGAPITAGHVLAGLSYDRRNSCSAGTYSPTSNPTSEPTISLPTMAPTTPGPTAAPVTSAPAAPDATATPTAYPSSNPSSNPSTSPVTSAPVSSAPTALTTNPSVSPTPIPIINTPQDCGQRHLDCTDGEPLTMGSPIRCSDSPPNPLARCLCTGYSICSDTGRPGRCSDNTVCRIRTAAPSRDPTSSPTSRPTKLPTAHVCSDGSHGCDSTRHGICEQLGTAEGEYRCSCAPTHHCSDGDCTTPGHTCEWNTVSPTSSPTSEPTRHPTQNPTGIPSRNPTTTAPTSSPSPPPTFDPTAGPSGSPTSTYQRLAQERSANGGRGFGYVTDAELDQQRRANAALGRGTISNAEAELEYPPTQPPTVAVSSTTERPGNAAGAVASSGSEDGGVSGVIGIAVAVVVGAALVVIAVAYIYTKQQLGKAAAHEPTGFDNPVYAQQQFGGDRSGGAVYSAEQGRSVGYMDVPATSSTSYLDVHASPPPGHGPAPDHMAMETSGYADVAPGFADDEEEEV